MTCRSIFPHRLGCDPGWNDRSIGADHFDGQGMHPALELGIEGLHDGTMLLHTGETGQRRTADSDAKMRFAFGTGAGMAAVAIAFVEDFKMVRSKF